MTYSAGQVVEVCSERSRKWTSGFKYGSKITLKRKRDHNDVFAGEWNARDASGAEGIISEDDFRLVPEHSPIRTETVQRIEPGVYGRLWVDEDTEGYASVALIPMLSDDDWSPSEGQARSLTAPELRELARVALEIAEYLENA